MMSKDPVELVARAFYAAEHSGEWRDEPEALKGQFRDLASTAIATLDQQMAEVRSLTMLLGVPRLRGPERSVQPRRDVG